MPPVVKTTVVVVDEKEEPKSSPGPTPKPTASKPAAPAGEPVDVLVTTAGADASTCSGFSPYLVARIVSALVMALLF